jgi:hypothetical protein
MLNKYPHLTITTIGVLTLTLNLLYKDYPFTIFIDNLFITLLLFSILCSYGIGVYETARTNRFLGHFIEETLKKNNNKML